MEVFYRVLLGVVIAELGLEGVAGQDDGLLVVAAQATVDYVHLKLKEIVISEKNVVH